MEFTNKELLAIKESLLDEGKNQLYYTLLGNCHDMTAEETEELGRKIDSIPNKIITNLEKDFKEYNENWNK